MLSTHYYLLLPGVCSSLSSVHCAVRLQNGSLSVLKYFSGKGGDQSGHLESLGGTSPDILILGGTSRILFLKTFTFLLPMSARLMDVLKLLGGGTNCQGVSA